jgi:hypothetical protein
MILRLPIQVHLFDESSQVVMTINSTKKSQIRLRVQGLSRSKWQYGTCRIWYNKPEDYYNEFTFTTVSQLDNVLTDDTEKGLITFLKQVIPKQYLEKRQLSAAQKQAVAKARERSMVAR